MHAHTQTHLHMQTHTHAHVNTHTCTCKHTHMHMETHKHMHMQTQMDMQTHMQMQTQMDMQTYMHMQTQMDIMLFCHLVRIIWFTSLCKKLVKLTWVFSRSFSRPCASFSMLGGPGGTGCNVLVRSCWKWCTWHRKASAKNSSKLNKFLHSEVNQLIQHIIMQDHDGQNNNKII